MKKVVVSVLVLVLFISLVWVFFEKYEGKDPDINVSLPSLYLNKDYKMDLSVSDQGTGLRYIHVALMQQGKETVLLSKTYPAKGFLNFFNPEKVVADSFEIPIESWRYGMTDGDAVVRILVSDYSWRSWNKGNQSYIEKQVIIDSKPPDIKILTQRHNVEKGGSGMVIYELSEDDVTSGVMVGDHFFPGSPGLFENKKIHTAFFALNHLQGPGTDMIVTAQDIAGNKTKRGFHHYIRDKNFKTDTLNISDQFLEQKISDFDIGEKQYTLDKSDDPLLEKFIYINSEGREANTGKILQSGTLSDNSLMWEGKFLRLPGSQRRASFADRRNYKYKGKEIGKAFHLGIDLASTSHADVPAANSGKVIFTGFEGIYGNSIILDHGFGLCSLYSHLSETHVTTGAVVKKGDIIGKTGMTGLAGGDHLHFSMMVHDTFVNPVEWWDAVWIENNILSKIEHVHQLLKK